MAEERVPDYLRLLDNCEINYGARSYTPCGYLGWFTLYNKNQALEVF
jgi:hypothetical protein